MSAGALKDIEVELTFPLLNIDEVRKHLATIATLEKDGERQRDTYYNAPHRDFLKHSPIAEWLRVRETNYKHSITYKHWHNQNNLEAVSCDELESVITNPEGVKALLGRLDFPEVVVVEKVRTTFRYKDVEVALDSVTDLGPFIELEAKGEFPSIEVATEHLYAVLKEIGATVGPQDFVGYPHLLLHKKGLLELPKKG